MFCDFIDCRVKRPNFNFPAETKGKFCSKHKENGMVDVRHKQCEREGCKTRPNFNFSNEINGKFCSKHRIEGMINVVNRKCEQKGCKSQPSFTYPDEIKLRFCSIHKKNGMIDKKHKKCKYTGCNSPEPVFNFPNETKGILCGRHKTEGMINIINKRCEGVGCKSQPIFNHPNETNRKFCSKHKTEGMVDVISRKCDRVGCKSQPIFNHPDEIKGKYCYSHKEEGMINVISRKCEAVDCKTRPSYNYPNEAKGRFCFDHKEEEMVDVIHKRCEREGCKARPNYNHPSEAKGKYCFNHKEEGMVDVQHKRCQVCGKNRAYFGYPGQTVSFCSTCKKEGTIREPKKKCTTEKCKEMALYGYRAQISCEKHKSEDMTNLVEKKCKKCEQVMVLSPDGFCEYCCDDWVGIVRKKKEYEIKHFLDKNGFSYISHDRKIQHSSLLSRPDFLFLSNNQKYYLVLEVDEYQHTFNKEECECVRMVNISQELGKPVIFIRYNPDEYKVGKKKHNPSLVERQKNLKVWLRGALSKSEEDIRNFGYLCFVQLYYDGYVKGSGKYETILGWE